MQVSNPVGNHSANTLNHFLNPKIMADMKTEFALRVKKPSEDLVASAKIVNYGGPRSFLIVDSRHVYPYKQGPNFELRGKSLETFAVNILKALNSKHLKSKKNDSKRIKRRYICIAR